MAQKLTKLEHFVDRQEQYSRRNCPLVHEIAETNDENTDDLVLKTINEKLDVEITEDEIDRSRRIEEHGFTNMWTTDGKILFKRPNENKHNYLMIRN